MKKEFLFLTFLLGSVASMQAQSDSLSYDYEKPKTDHDASWRKQSYFDALDYMHVNRYRPTDSVFVNSFSKNIFVSVYGQLEKTQSHLGERNPRQYGAGITIGKQYSKFNTARLSFDYMPSRQLLPNSAQHSETHYDVTLSHLFNFIHYLYGYNPSRRYHLNSVLGAGLSYDTDNKLLNPELYGGVNLMLWSTQHTSLYIEPLFMLRSDRSSSENYRKYDYGWNVRAGINYHFTGLPTSTINTISNINCLDNLFFEYGLGYATKQKEEPTRKGPSTYVHLGKWFDPFGARVGGFTTLTTKDINVDLGSRHTIYAGARAEMMLNLSRLFFPAIEHPTIEFDGFAGYELGAVAHSYSPNRKERRTKFYGYTFGVDMVYNIRPTVALFAEGRYESLRSILNGYLQAEKMTTISIGTRVTRREPIYKERLALRKAQFEPYWFTEFTGGLSTSVRTINRAELKKSIGTNWGVGLGRQFTPVSGVRASFNVENILGPHTNFIPAVLQGDYIWSATNSFMGYNPNRRFDLNLFAGLNLFYGTDPFKFSLGGQAGAIANVRLTNSLDLFAEPKLRVFVNQPYYLARSFFGFRSLVYANLGVRYKFSNLPTIRPIERFAFMDGAFVSLQAGPQLQLNNSQHFRTATNVDVSVGKWFNTFGVRLSVFGAAGTMDEEFTVSRKKYGQENRTQDYLGGRAELMLSLADLWSSEPYDRKFEVNLIGGPAIGYVLNQSSHNNSRKAWMTGFSLSTQLVWNINRHVGLFFEPRYTELNYKFDKYSLTDPVKNIERHYLTTEHYKDRMFNFNVGLTFKGEAPVMFKSSKSEFFAHNFITIDYVANAGVRSISAFKLKDYVGSSFAMGLGRQLDPLSAVSIDFQGGNFAKQGGSLSVKKIGLHYRFGLTNFFAGYKANRFFSFEPAIGVNYTISDEMVDEYNKNVNGAVGLDLYGRFNFRVNNTFSIYVAPETSFYFNRLSPSYTNIRGNSASLNLHLGIQYNL